MLVVLTCGTVHGCSGEEQLCVVPEGEGDEGRLPASWSGGGQLSGLQVAGYPFADPSSFLPSATELPATPKGQGWFWAPCSAQSCGPGRRIRPVKS